MNEEQKYIDFETITVRKTQESKLVVISVNKVHDGVCQLNCVTLDCQELLGDNPKRLFLGKLGQGSMPCQSFSTLVA